MKKNFALLMAAVMTLGLTACGSSSVPSSSNTSPSNTSPSSSDSSATDDGQTYVLHAAYSVAEDENSQHTIKFNKIKEIVEEKTGGKVQIVIHPGGELGSEKEYVEMMQNGEIAMASISTSMLSGFTPALAFFDCPFLFESQDQLKKFIDEGNADEKWHSVSEYWS